MNLVPCGCRSSSLWNKEGEEAQVGGVEEQRKEESLLKESMMMAVGWSDPVRVLRPITLSLELNWEEVSELSMTEVKTHREEKMNRG